MSTLAILAYCTASSTVLYKNKVTHRQNRDCTLVCSDTDLKFSTLNGRCHSMRFLAEDYSSRLFTYIFKHESSQPKVILHTVRVEGSSTSG